MPDTPAPAHKGVNAFTHKVGPLPVWAYAVLAVAAWYWYTHYGPGASKTAATAAAAAAPADASIGSNEVTTALYSDDAAWAQAAITYLTGIGIPQAQATTEIDNYLRGLPNTAQGQSDVQLAVNSVGPPPVNAPSVTPPAPVPVPVPVKKPPIPIDHPKKHPPKPPAPHGKCKPGWHFVPDTGKEHSGAIPAGAYIVEGGLCVRDAPGPPVVQPPGKQGGGGTGTPPRRPGRTAINPVPEVTA